MPKVTYLFGAGASADRLPLVRDIPDRLRYFNQYVGKNRRALDATFPDLSPCSIKEIQGEEMLLTATERLAEEAGKHSSIDTYAKKLFITGKMQEYADVKALLSCFFLYEQADKTADNRYDSFFASILGRHHLEFEGDIRILSWNYDYQFEKAYSVYSGDESLPTNRGLLNVHNPYLKYDSTTDRFAIYKINGTAGYKDLANNHLNKFHDLKPISGSSLVEKLVWYYLAATQLNNKIQPLLTFAWEGDSKPHILEACDQVRNSEALVVIGYSFPFFNRKVDKQIMQSLSYFDRAKIYIQDKNPKPIIEKLPSVLPVGRHFEVIPVDAVDQFFLPPEI
jgi:hypothetical protein